MINRIAAPRRKYELKLTLGADSERDIFNTLNDVKVRLMTGPPEPENPVYVTSAGPSSGWVLEVTVDPEMDHDAYMRRLGAYLEAMGVNKE